MFIHLVDSPGAIPRYWRQLPALLGYSPDEGQTGA